MVSFHYAKSMDEVPDLPVFIDSGGFALLLEGAELFEREDGLGDIGYPLQAERLAPEQVLALQEARADWASTLDFPIPVGCDPAERERRLRLTLANAQWAMEHQTRKSMRLFGSVQGWDLASYLGCARDLIGMGFTDLAIGGLVPRARQKEFLREVTRSVRALMPETGLLHLFGIGEPETVRGLFASGATSVDSSSFVRAAASGKRWDGEWSVDNPSGLERAHAAIANLIYAMNVSGAGAEVEEVVEEEAGF